MYRGAACFAAQFMSRQNLGILTKSKVLNGFLLRNFPNLVL